MKSSDNEDLERYYNIMDYIVNFCQKHFSGNSLVIKSKELCKTIVPETNILQEPLDNEEEHQKGEVEDKHNTTNSKFVYDASISSNDSYCAETKDNLSAEALCLYTHLENTNNDELEIKSCSINEKVSEEHILMKYLLLMLIFVSGLITLELMN